MAAGHSTTPTHPLDRLSAHGGTDYRLCIPRTDNPFPASDPAHAAWHEQWDAAALEGARILKASAAQRLYRVSLAAATLLHDMRSNPRTLTPRSQRYREVEDDLKTALSSALAATGTQQSIAGTPVDLSTPAPSGRLPAGESEGATNEEA